MRALPLIGALAVMVVLATLARASPPPHTDVLLIKLTFTNPVTRRTASDGAAYCQNGKSSLQSIARAAPQGNLLWNVPVPGWFSPRQTECDVSPWVKDWHSPEERGYDYESLGIRFARTLDSLVFATAGGMFALAATDGRLRFEWVAHKTSESFYYFDSGSFEVHRGQSIVCTGKADAARVLAACEDRIFFFDQQVAVALAANSGKVIAETPFEQRFRARGATVTRDQARIPLGPYDLVLRGITFL